MDFYNEVNEAFKIAANRLNKLDSRINFIWIVLIYLIIKTW